MITMLGSRRRCCDGITRRETLKAGALSALGGLFSIPTLLRAEETRSPARPGKARSVIVLYLMGGAATQDMWDLKPDSPLEVRGEFKPIATNVPGIQICEHLPRMAQWMHKAAIVRSVTHNAGAHNTLPSYTGYEEPILGVTVTKDSSPPGMPAVCEYLKTGSSDFPASVYMPCYLGWGQLVRRAGPYAGFLGKRYDPLFTECSPYVAKPPEARDYPQVLLGEPRFAESTLADGITIDRLTSRRTLLQQIDDRLPHAESQAAAGGFDRFQQRAFSMLTAPKVKAAFELDREDAKLRDRYGRNLFGSSSLIARRLVESGVRFVNVTWDIYWERLLLQNAG